MNTYILTCLLVKTFRASRPCDLKAHGNALLKSGAAGSNEQAIEVPAGLVSDKVKSACWLFFFVYGCLWQVSDDEYCECCSPLLLQLYSFFFSQLSSIKYFTTASLCWFSHLSMLVIVLIVISLIDHTVLFSLMI